MSQPHDGDLRLIPLTKGLILAEQVLTLLSVIVASEEQTDSPNPPVGPSTQRDLAQNQSAHDPRVVRGGGPLDGRWMQWIQNSRKEPPRVEIKLVPGTFGYIHSRSNQTIAHLNIPNQSAR